MTATLSKSDEAIAIKLSKQILKLGSLYSPAITANACLMAIRLIVWVQESENLAAGKTSKKKEAA